MNTRDLILIGAPALVGGSLLAAFLLRTWEEPPAIFSKSGYRSAHERLTDWSVSKHIFRFPGARLVTSVRHWAFAELLSLVVFVAIVSGNRSAAGLLQGAATAALPGFGCAWISFRGAAREALRSVQRDLPVACFLFSLLLESGMGPASALKETSDSLPEGVLARELRDLVRSRTIGVSREESIGRSRERVPVEEYQLFMNHILQGERLGVGLSRSLRELSSRMLESQGHRAETIAQQAAVKMLFPLVCFIFPAVFLIILSPVILGLWGRITG